MKSNKSINSVSKYLIKHCRPILPLASTAALVAITGIASPAKALTFNWQFANTIGGPLQSGVVTGTISGLNDNQAFQTSGFTVTVTSAPNTPPGGWINDWYNAGPFGVGAGWISVAGGQITNWDIYLYNSSGYFLDFGDPNNIYSPRLDDRPAYTSENIGLPGTTTFTATAPVTVPGPLPVLGAASAFGWSRRVRKRLRASQHTSQA